MNKGGITNNDLVGGFLGLNPGEKYMISSIGMIIEISNIWEKKIDVPNHQPVIVPDLRDEPLTLILTRNI